VFCIVSETTGRVVGERRLRTLRDLGRSASDARSVDEALRKARDVLADNPLDLPFALLLDAQGAPREACRIEPRGGWPIERAQANEVVLRDAELAPFGPFSGGPWPEPPHTAVVLAIATPGQPAYGYLVAGISPRRALDDAYWDFLRLVASNIAAGVAAARALEEQRAQAEALAELDRAKTAFFSNVSHEFRTPLTLLLGPLQDALARVELSGDVRRNLETAERNAERLLKLVNTLLDFSRIEAGRAQARFAPTDLARFTAELASNFASACEKAGLRLIVDCAPLGQPAYVDRGMWEKIVLNLLSNALKFTFEGEIEVTLRASGQAAEMRVRDTGIGIAAAELPRLFERFYRVEGARSRTHEGSGIGLAFVQELVRMHGGEIEVASEPGRGSLFTVTIPLGSAHLPERHVVAESAPAQPASVAAFVAEAMGWLGDAQEARPEAPPRDAQTRILVVDDNADMRGYIARLLRERWSVSTATNGRQALELVRGGGFDLVISDVMMPELDGFALVQAIKSDPASAELPVMLVSARAGEESRVDGLAAGADDYIVKPFTAHQLVAQVNAQLTIRRARRRTAQDLHALFMQAPSPIVILRGAANVIELANPAACRLWDRRPEQVAGRPLLEALPELRGQGFDALIEAVRHTGEPYEGRETPARLRRADGEESTLYLNFVYTPLRDLDGAIEGVLVTAFDVTAQVAAREQTSALRREAESANRAKDEFLAMLSHELRNPLAPISTAIQLIRLRGTELPELGVLERQTAHLKRLVDDLLDVSRITRGKIELRRRAVELSEAVLRAMEMAGPLLEPRAHRVDIRAVPAAGLAAYADPDRLAQILFNLLANAAKYSEPGSPIAVRAWAADDRVAFSVRDEGAGIAPEMIGRVFDMFVQQEQTIARSEGGLGLGLTIVRSLVELHGGSVAVQSPGLGKGSEFTVELPAAHAMLDAAGNRVAGRTAARPRRVLVVDDNVDAASGLAELLRALGHEVELAHDGPRALAAARRFTPELALIDIGLPLMDGYELARRLRTELAGRPVELVAVTGYGLERDRERSAQAGFADHLVKPIELASLERLLAG
jgi:PAS domain S-box-containing protein